MKKIMRRVLGAALAVVMSVGLLSGCGGEADPIQEAFDGKYTKDTVMLKVNGSDVTAEDLFFWMAQNADYVAGYYTQMGMEMDWSSASMVPADRAPICSEAAIPMGLAPIASKHSR